MTKSMQSSASMSGIGSENGETTALQAGADEPTAPETAPRGGRRRQESRRKLLAAARRLFVERGYHDTRPQDIAREADVGHGTFYLHFPDKRACFFAFVDEACAELDARVTASTDGVDELEMRLERILQAVIDFHLENPGVLLTALSNPGVIAAGADHRISLISRWAQNWSERLSEQAKAGLVYDDYDLNVVGWALIGMLHPTCVASIATPETRDEVVDNLKRMLVRALVRRSS